MKQGIKTRMLVVVALLASFSISAVTIVKKPRPDVAKENMLINIPGRFYYFEEDELHCYNSQSREDALITKDFMYETGSSKYRITDVWHDATTNNVYINLDQSGTQIQNKYIYQLAPDYSMEEIIGLTGDISDVLVDVTDDYVCLNGYIEDSKIPGITGDGRIYEFYTKGFKPWKMTKRSLDLLKKPDVSFYTVTTPGVNVRSYGDSKAPRIGYFKARQGWEEEEFWLRSEDADIDSRIFTRTFRPWHPEAGTVFASQKLTYCPDGWTNLFIGDINSDAYVSSKFVKKSETAPITGMQDIPAGDLKDRVYRMNSTKYPGVWLMIGELPDCGEAPLYIGKEIDGMVVFKWMAGWPICSGESGKGIHIDQNNTVFYGKNVIKNEYELDLSKINDSDLETLFQIAQPSGGLIMVKIPEQGVRTFSVKQ